MAADARKEMKRLTRLARDQGWAVQLTGGGHYMFLSPDASVPPIYTSSTPSDFRSMRNFKARLARSGLRMHNESAMKATRRSANGSPAQHATFDLAEAKSAMEWGHAAADSHDEVAAVRYYMRANALGTRAYASAADAQADGSLQDDPRGYARELEGVKAEAGDLVQFAEERVLGIVEDLKSSSRRGNGRRVSNTHDPNLALENAREATDATAAQVRAAEVSAREGDHDQVINHLARADRYLGMAEVYTSFSHDAHHATEVPGLQTRQEQLAARIETVRGGYGYVDHEADVRTRMANATRLRGRLTER